MNDRRPNACFDCDWVSEETRKLKEASKWTCVRAPREGITGVVDESYVLPNPYELCWKVRMIFPRSCPLYRQRLPGQRSLNIEGE